MANRAKGELTVKHEGKDYTFALDFNALCEFEDATGKDALDVLRVIESGKGRVSDIRALMWAGLRAHHPEVTLHDAGRILASNSGAVMEGVAAAFGGAEGDEGNAKRGKAKAG